MVARAIVVNVLRRHFKACGNTRKGRMLGKKGRRGPKRTFIMKACRDVSLQTYLKLQRAVGDRHQWMTIIRMFHDRPWG